MGFSCDFRRVPKYKDISAATVLATFMWAKFQLYTQSNWAQEQIARGYTFHIEEYHRGIKVEDISDDEDIRGFYLEVVKNMNTYETDNCVEYWCSIGHIFDDDIKRMMPQIDDGYYQLTDESINRIIEYCNDWLKDHELEEVQPTYAYKYNEDESVTLIPMDGIEIQFQDGTCKRFEISDEWPSGIYASLKYFDTEEKWAIERLKDCMETCKNLITTNYIYYSGN